MADEPFIIWKGGYVVPIIQMFEKAEAKLRVEYAIHNVSTLLNMVQEGLGLAILSELSLASLPLHVVTRELEPMSWRKIGLALPSVQEASLAVQLFIQIMQELYQEEDP